MSRLARPAAALLGGLAPGAALMSWHVDPASQQQQPLRRYSFGDFVSDFGRTYERGSEEWARRESIFNASLSHVLAFELKAEGSWSKGVTKFMDYSEDEFKAILGYRGRGRSDADALAMPVGRPSIIDSKLPKKMVLLKDSNSLLSSVRDQGQCGSCWAEAATAVLEGAMEQNPEVLTAMVEALNGTDKFARLSAQAMVSCTQNPSHCGGTGGCEGATAELGYDMLKDRGMPLAVTWGDISAMGWTGKCRDEIFSTVRLGITGYQVLPTNRLWYLKEALVNTNAPIVVSVDASHWAFYRKGVYSDTTGSKKGEFQLNHAVALVGYSEPEAGETGYWLIKNSWGRFWGESGFMRLEMKAHEETHCGWDTQAQEGVACEGDPDTVWVCGTCGILYDSVYPTGLHVVAGEPPLPWVPPSSWAEKKKK